MDFDGNGVTDYVCKIHTDVVGQWFSINSNSFATPIAFARYTCKLMGELANKKPKDAAQHLKKLNLYDFAFPNLETYQKHDSYGKNGYRPIPPTKVVA